MKTLDRACVGRSDKGIRKIPCRSRKEGLKCTQLASLAFPQQYKAEGKIIFVLVKAGLLAQLLGL